MVTDTTTYTPVDVRALGDDPESFTGRRVAVEGVLALIYKSEDGPLAELHAPIGPSPTDGIERIGVLFADNPARLTLGARVRVSGQVLGARPIVSGYACGYTLQPLLRADAIIPLDA
jgi:hypothetical protein